MNTTKRDRMTGGVFAFQTIFLEYEVKTCSQSAAFVF